MIIKRKIIKRRVVKKSTQAIRDLIVPACIENTKTRVVGIIRVSLFQKNIARDNVSFFLIF